MNEKKDGQHPRGAGGPDDIGLDGIAFDLDGFFRFLDPGIIITGTDAWTSTRTFLACSFDKVSSAGPPAFSGFKNSLIAGVRMWVRQIIGRLCG